MSALRLMDRNPEIDIMGGDYLNLPYCRRSIYHTLPLYPNEQEPTRPPGSTIAGLRVCDKVENFFIAQADGVRQIGWDPELRVLEHTDFFTMAKGTLTTVFNPSLTILHARTPYDAAYMAKRNREDPDREVLRRKWHIGV